MFICTGWGCSAWSTADRRRGCSSPAQHFTIIIYNMNFTRALGLCSHHTGGMADLIDRPRFWHPFPQMSQGFVSPRRCRHCSCCPRRRQIDKKQHSENMLDWQMWFKWLQFNQNPSWSCRPGIETALNRRTLSTQVLTLSLWMLVRLIAWLMVRAELQTTCSNVRGTAAMEHERSSGKSLVVQSALVFNRFQQLLTPLTYFDH